MNSADQGTFIIDDGDHKKRTTPGFCALSMTVFRCDEPYRDRIILETCQSKINFGRLLGIVFYFIHGFSKKIIWWPVYPPAF